MRKQLRNVVDRKKSVIKTGVEEQGIKMREKEREKQLKEVKDILTVVSGESDSDKDDSEDF